MTTINNAYINALLADASYVSDLADDQTGGTLKPKLDVRLTPTLAKFIADNFTVISVQDTPDAPFGSSFEGVVWQGNAGTPYAGKTYVSMRGTQQLTDFLVDGDLALFGAARAQIADMVNWWLRITTAAGEPVPQIENLSSPTVDANGQYQYFKFIAPAPGTGKLVGATHIEVNGHSLGGHMATAFARIFGGSTTIDHVSTFNSAGFTLGSEAVFQSLQNMLGTGMNTFPNAAQQTNFFAKNGLNITTNSFWFNQIGQRVDLFNEEGTGFPNHYMYKLTDALALGNALAKLDPTLNFGRLNALFEAGANRTEASLEGILDGLRKTLLGSSATTTPVGDVSGSDSLRLAYHQNLNDLMAPDSQGNPTGVFAALQGKVQIATAPTDGLAAKSDFGAFLSLHTLTPFTLQGDGTVETALANAWNTRYIDWLADKALSAEDRANGKAYFSDEYLTDRAAMLGWIASRNVKDVADGGILSGPAQLFRDVASGTEIRMGVVSDANRRQFLFGAEGEDVFSGGGKSDRLYGGGGADKIDGRGDNDRLEGNAGDDALDGGDGRDLLLGGAGGDTLVGGLGDDTLKGGDGDDTYRIQSGDGNDTIRDNGGNNTIEVDGIALTGGKLIAKSVDAGGNGVYLYRSDDGKFTYQYDKGEQLSRLTVNGTIKIEDFKPEHYTQIQLPDAFEPVEQAMPTQAKTSDTAETHLENYQGSGLTVVPANSDRIWVYSDAVRAANQSIYLEAA